MIRTSIVMIGYEILFINIKYQENKFMQDAFQCYNQGDYFSGRKHNLRYQDFDQIYHI